MSARITDRLDPPFEVVEPAALSGPVVCNSPHSGRSYPASFLAQSRLDLAALRRWVPDLSSEVRRAVHLPGEHRLAAVAVDIRADADR